MRSILRTIVTASTMTGVSGCFSPGGLVIDLPGPWTGTDPGGGTPSDSPSPTTAPDSTSTATTDCDSCESSVGGDSTTETTGGCSSDCSTGMVTGAGDPSSTTCEAGCGPPGCGDGQVVAPEECDDQNDNDNDECSSSCVRPRRVFVTAATYDGGELGGLAGADAACQASARPAGLSGSFKAWLSDDQGSPATRLDTSFTGAYQRVDKIVIAVGWDQLSDGSLLAPISIDEFGAEVMVSTYAWTGTTTMGAAALQTCNGWTSAAIVSVGAVGNTTKEDATWTAAEVGSCSGAWRLYCFEDP